MGACLACCACEALSCAACQAAKCCCCPGRCCGGGRKGSSSLMTRVTYLFIFLIWAVLAWVLSNWGEDILSKIPYLSNELPSDLFNSGVTFRLTGALGVFHVVMAVILIGVKNSQDPRAFLQNKLWLVKLAVLVLLTVGAFFLPNTALPWIGWIAFVGAALFILVQLVLLVDFSFAWNSAWVENWENSDDNSWKYMLLGAMAGLYTLALGLTITMYILFARGDGCSLNIFFISANWVFGFLVSAASVSSAVREHNPTSGILQSGVVFAFCSYLVFSAILSEDETWTCSHSFTSSDASENATAVMGALFGIVSVIYSTLRMSSQGDKMMGGGGMGAAETTKMLYDEEGGMVGDDDDDEAPDEEVDGVAYSYTYMHLTFALGASYMAMLLTSWVTLSAGEDTHASNDISVGTGTAAVWVKIVSSWIVFGLYTWSLVAPVLLPDRDFSRQLVGL